MTCGIYCIRNKTSGKRYIGQSINVKNRLDQHLRDLKNNRSQSSILQKAWNGYGEEHFEFYLIILLPKFLKFLLDTLERFFIFTLKSHMSQKGYNISWGGNTPMKYRRHTDDEKKKASENNGKYWLGKTRSRDSVEKMRLTKIGKKASEETKIKMGKSHCGRKQNNGGTSKFVGTYKRNDNGKYRSSIQYLGRVYRSKSFFTEDEAALAYDELYKNIHGTSFGPNFPNGYLLKTIKEDI